MSRQGRIHERCEPGVVPVPVPWEGKGGTQPFFFDPLTFMCSHSPSWEGKWGIHRSRKELGQSQDGERDTWTCHDPLVSLGTLLCPRLGSGCAPRTVNNGDGREGSGLLENLQDPSKVGKSPERASLEGCQTWLEVPPPL